MLSTLKTVSQISLIFLMFTKNHFSAKSRIKGTLDIYHAFIHEDQPNTNVEDWEHTENVSTTGTAQTGVG